MQQFIDAARGALETGNSYAALSLALALPDMAAASVEPKTRAGERYKAWWEKYCQHKYTMYVGGRGHVFLGGSDAYALRCAVLHQGFDDLSEHGAREALDSFKFVQPARGSVHKVQVNRKLALQVDLFVEDICASAESFLLDVEANVEVQKRLAQALVIDDLKSGLSL